MKHQWIILGILSATVVSTAPNAIADTASDDRNYADRQRADLEDREKQLLREEDRLKQDVEQLKREIAGRLDKVDVAQRRLERINHELITLRMKLMP